MEMQFDEWLRQLARAGKLIPDGSVTIDRGLPFRWACAIKGDWSGSILAASLRLYPDAAGSTVADLSSATPVYDDASDLTTFVVSLSPGQTAALPADSALEGTVPLALDVLMTPPGSYQFRLMGGIATIAGRVTNGS